MKKSEVVEGAVYRAKVSGGEVSVRVDKVLGGRGYGVNGGTRYEVVNLKSGRKLTFRSAARFRPALPEHGGYICSSCGEEHASDDTELWCSISRPAGPGVRSPVVSEGDDVEEDGPEVPLPPRPKKGRRGYDEED